LGRDLRKALADAVLAPSRRDPDPEHGLPVVAVIDRGGPYHLSAAAGQQAEARTRRAAVPNADAHQGAGAAQPDHRLEDAVLRLLRGRHAAQLTASQAAANRGEAVDRQRRTRNRVVVGQSALDRGRLRATVAWEPHPVWVSDRMRPRAAYSQMRVPNCTG